jgi:hypothetical protein
LSGGSTGDREYKSATFLLHKKRLDAAHGISKKKKINFRDAVVKGDEIRNLFRRELIGSNHY